MVKHIILLKNSNYFGNYLCWYREKDKQSFDPMFVDWLKYPY